MTDSPTARDGRSSSMGDSVDTTDARDVEPSAAPEDGSDRPRLERTVPLAAAPIRRIGFWAAIVLPFCYVPLLAYGLTSWPLLAAFLALVAVNLVALYVGHGHGR